MVLIHGRQCGENYPGQQIADAEGFAYLSLLMSAACAAQTDPVGLLQIPQRVILDESAAWYPEIFPL